MFSQLCIISLIYIIIHIQGAYGYLYMMVHVSDKHIHVFYSNTKPYPGSNDVKDSTLNLEDVYSDLIYRSYGTQAISHLENIKNKISKQGYEKLVVDHPGAGVSAEHWHTWETTSGFANPAPSRHEFNLINDVCSRRVSY
ncbi:hypothetical protein PGT21_027121 [Puccinia graminis f. sp. tritici]|uniref:Uncharacterized protein n=1 Tax=Puccinia graminis f. sp. tritici TaxID=56615 RepID=A0A5B0R1V2_PUCGR|nr:hypothetical protein PGT21_027121 [Puccinia graminis f. sp. tritici]